MVKSGGAVSYHFVLRVKRVIKGGFRSFFK